MSSYVKRPEIKVKKFEQAYSGYPSITQKILQDLDFLDKEHKVVVIECYPGVRYEELLEHLIRKLHPDRIIESDPYFFDAEKMNEFLKPILTEDPVFGIMSHFHFKDFLLTDKKNQLLAELSDVKGLTVIYGTGASVVYENQDILIYADLPRWEIQCRYRNGMGNWKAHNENEDIRKKYKRGFFFEWRVSDRRKQELYKDMDYILDTTVENEPKMISGKDYRQGLKETVRQPFRVVPYFEPSVWGGHWMKEHFDLDDSQINYGWGFDGVPEENSLILNYGGIRIEVPAINLVFAHPRELLGDKVYARFGKEFPIRFDFLDTMGGGNLSLQVHPLTEYIQDRFGMHYTQDESYYIFQAGEDSSVFLGLKNDVNFEEMADDLKKAQKGNHMFPAEKYVNQFPVRKHDHLSIPAGTIHCSGANTVVLEISATPNLFTFKLWDWGRVDLDGKPRPIHLEHGLKNIVAERNTDWVKKHLINGFSGVPELEHEQHIIEKTGLHEFEFIETHRHWFKRKAIVETHESVNMLNLVEGDKIFVKSLDGSFAPFEVHYGETFIVPAIIGQYALVNAGDPNKPVAVIQAYVRNYY